MVLFQNLLPKFTLQRSKPEQVFRIVFNDELHTAITKITYTIEEDDWMIYQVHIVHIIKLGVRS